MDKTDIIKYKNLFYNELFENCIPFWQRNAIDQVNGGIYSCLDRKGNVYSTDKSVWMQGRCGWTFSFLCNTYGVKKEWLDTAKSCIDFLDKFCIDKEDGRMYFTVTGDGRPLRKRRYFFSETFYIMANAEYSLAAGDRTCLQKARNYYDMVYNIYKNPSCDPYKITPKVLPDTRRMRSLANPMILLNVTTIMRRCDPQNTGLYNLRSNEFINDIIKYFLKPDMKLLLENVDMDGGFLSDISTGRIVNPGHDIEASWFILEEAVNLKSEEYAKTASDIFDWAIARGWDEEYSGILYFIDALGNPPEQYEHDMKLWWPHNETLIASLRLYMHTGEKKYADWFKKLAEYSFHVFADHEYGEWYGYLRRDGKPTEPPCKGSTYKGPFHLPRMLILVDRMLEELYTGFA